MSEEYGQGDSDRPEEHEDQGPEAESGPDIAAAVAYGERYEACQATARKVQAARRLVELAGGYREAMVLADAIWFVDKDHVDKAGTSDTDEDGSKPDCEAWAAKVRRVMAAEKLLQLASGYTEALVLLDATVVALQGHGGYQQLAAVRGAAAGYHARVAAALKRREEGK